MKGFASYGLAAVFLAACASPDENAGQPSTAKPEGQLIGISASGKIWAWRKDGSARSGRLFFDIRGDAAAALRSAAKEGGPYIGTIPVRVTLGDRSWNSSVIDASSHDGYLLEINSGVAASEKLEDGSSATLTIEIRR